MPELEAFRWVQRWAMLPQKAPEMFLPATGGWLENVLPPAPVRVDLLGNGTLPWMALPPAPLEVLNDLNGLATNFFRALRDPKRLRDLFFLSRLIPAHHDGDQRCLLPLLATGEDREPHPTSGAWVFYLRARRLLMARLGRRKTKIRLKRHPEEIFDRQFAGKLYRTFDHIDPQLSDVHGRLIRMQIDHYPVEKIIEIYDSPDTLFWADPREEDYVDVMLRLNEVQGAAALYDHSYESAAGALDILNVPNWSIMPLNGGAILSKPAAA